MNLDFHLYGTYSAAILAGMNLEEAKTIALAAQMVDDFTESITEDVMLATATDIDNNLCSYAMNCLKSTTMGWFSVNPKYVDIISKISYAWVGFHFLPGIPAKELIPDNIDDKSALLCGINGKAFQYLKNEISKGGESITVNGILPLGITMHVLADTFAHSGFSGLINRNPIIQDEMKIIEDGQEYAIPKSFIRMPESGKKIIPGAFYMGHAVAGHFPDISTAVIKYNYEISGKKVSFSKDNKDYFANAFVTLIQFMDSYNKRKKHNDKYYDIWYKGVYEALETFAFNKRDHLSFNERYTVENDKSFEWLLEDLEKVSKGVFEKYGQKSDHPSYDKDVITANILSPNQLLGEYKNYLDNIKAKRIEFDNFLSASSKLKTAIFNNIVNPENPKENIDIYKLISKEY